MLMWKVTALCSRPHSKSPFCESHLQEGLLRNILEEIVCVFKDEATGEVIATDREKDGLHQLNQVGQTSACVARPATLEVSHQ